MRDKRLSIDFIQKSSDELATKSTPEQALQLKTDMKSLRSHYQSLNDIVNDRITRLDKLISDLRKFQDDYSRTLTSLNRIDANLQIEHHIAGGSGGGGDSISHGKSIEAQLSNLKQVKYDLDTLYTSVNQLNEQTQKYLYAPHADPKFTIKLKSDINELNDKLAHLRNVYTKKQYHLEDALIKSTKVDNEIEELENWISYKEHEILDDEGIIITEEQFDQRKIKYKQIKSEIERKETAVKRVLDNGNEMLKSSTNVADLARNMININNKWSNLNRRVEFKNSLFTQLDEYINELRHLLHQENNWLEKVQQKISSSKVGADAEELSEELDSIERLLKSHSHQPKERINDLSSLLVEKNVLIQLANSDAKEFTFRWQLIHDEANKKLQSLDNAINDVQNWERRLLELQDWIIYMDKYLSTRIDQDIFADDVPDDFVRIEEEFHVNEMRLKELDEGVDKYKHDAATRLDQQLNIMKKNWTDLSHKFKKFQKPADFDLKLNKVRKSLDEIDQALHMIDVNTEDSDTIHLQLEHCMKFYKTLSELKSQIEFVLKQGRSIVDKRQVDNTDELTKQLDTLKLKYNELGARVTTGKNELEKAFKHGKKFRKEYNLIGDFLGKIDGELRKIEQKPLSKNYNDELEWIKNTKIEINKVETVNLETMKQLKKALEELVQRKAASHHLSGAASKILDIEQKVSNIQRRIDERASFLHNQASKLDESYETFLTRARQVLVQLEQLQHELIEAERLHLHNADASGTARESYDRIEREVNTLLSDVEMIRAQGTDLCGKSEQYSRVVETELRTVITNFEDLNRRLNLAQERVQSRQENRAWVINLSFCLVCKRTLISRIV